jgi:hypothetical protein
LGICDVAVSASRSSLSGLGLSRVAGGSAIGINSRCLFSTCLDVSQVKDGLFAVNCGDFEKIVPLLRSDVRYA